MSQKVLISVFRNEDDVLKATAAARKQGLDIVDVYTPYAVHGLDRAMGLPPSRLPWVTFILGLTGALTMTIFQYWASAVDWPINVGGKPWHSWPAPPQRSALPLRPVWPSPHFAGKACRE